MVFDLRDELIEAVRYGRMTPAEAERQALQAGFTPLAHEPDPNLFDPLRKSFWTPAMAVAWIA
jgi:hypothetical protein